MKSIIRSVARLTVSLILLAAIGTGQDRLEPRDEGRVYVMVNGSSGNTIMVLQRSEDGQLSLLQEVSTGGLGSGPGELPPPFPPGLPGPNELDSQDALVMTDNGRFLIAVNAGSNDISVLAVTHDGLELVDRKPSGGVFPVSIAHHRNLVYAINNGGRNFQVVVGGIPTVQGFRLDEDGKLHPIEGSQRVIGPNMAHPADGIFSPDGDVLLIAEQSTNEIKAYEVEPDGVLGNERSYHSTTPTPFGLAFGRHDTLAVTAVNGLPVGVQNGATVSSYHLRDEGSLRLISSDVPSHQSAACWVRFTPNGKYAYTANPSSGSLSSFTVSSHGEFSALASVAADVGGHFSGPLDLDITPNGKFLYVIGSFIGTIQGFQIGNDGALTHIASFGGLPFTVQGLVVR